MLVLIINLCLCNVIAYRIERHYFHNDALVLNPEFPPANLVKFMSV